jgi:hypothetical protein
MGLYVLGGSFQDEADMMPAVIAWWEFLTIHAGHFMFFGMMGVVNYSVDSRVRDYLPGPELIP